LSQKTTEEYKVVLNVPYLYKNNDNEKYEISDNLKSFQEEHHSKLIINRVEEDFGPVVKLTGVLSLALNPEDVLIICDDDHVYREDMLDYYLKKMEQYPDSAICFRGDIPVEKREWQEDGVKKYVIRHTHLFFPVKHDSQLAIPGHWHSVAYKRRFFNDDFLNKYFLYSCNNDDQLVGYYLKKNQIDIVCAAWDGETDWRAVNENGRGASSFPIESSLAFPNSGFYEFRKGPDGTVLTGNGYGNSEDFVQELLHDQATVYSE
jgi:hypothetical protein